MRTRRPSLSSPALSVRPFDQPISSLDARITLSASATTATVARIERDEIESRMITLRKLARRSRWTPPSSPLPAKTVPHCLRLLGAECLAMCQSVAIPAARGTAHVRRTHPGPAGNRTGIIPCTIF